MSYTYNDNTRKEKKNQVERTEIRIISREEIREVLIYLCKRKNGRLWKERKEKKIIMFSLAVFSGLRANEIATLEWKDIMQGFLPKDWFIPTCPKKGNRMPALMNEMTFECLVSLKKRTREKAVIGCDRKNVWRMWDKLQKDIWGYRAYRFHDLRHTAITRYYEHTRDIWKTKEFARHTELSTTQKYIHLAERPEMEQALREIVQEVDVRKVIGVIGI